MKFIDCEGELYLKRWLRQISFALQRRWLRRRATSRILGRRVDAGERASF
jgi:hypothetical protein